MKTSNDNASVTPTLDTVLAVLCGADPDRRWMLEGWAGHLRPTRHQNHAASSHAKHAGEFGDAYEFALALTIARCVDFGITAEDARALVDAQIEVRATKAAA